MEQIMGAVTSVAVEIITIIIGALGVAIANKIKQYVDGLKKKDELQIIDSITDAVVEWAEAELMGKSGVEKRDFAVSKALEILESKGIILSEAEVIAGIENGVRKLKQKQVQDKILWKQANSI